jgi:hypothetical protein
MRQFFRPHVLAGRAVLIATLAATGAQAQTPPSQPGDLVEAPRTNQPLQRSQRPSVGVAPLVGRLSFNGTNLEFKDTWIANLSIDGGSYSNAVGGRELTYVFGRKALQRGVQHATGVTFDSNQRAWVFQLRATDRVRRVVTTRDVGGQLVGFNLNFSATGRCFLPGSPVDGYCTYTPGMSTVEGGYDPDKLVPNVFALSTAFGQEIPRAVHESLKAEGFQRGEDIPGAALVGLHFDAPNAGFVAGRGGTMNGAYRRSRVERRLVPSLGRIDQTIASNRREAAATRTTRAFVLLDRDEWTTGAVLLQLFAPFLPAAPTGVAQTPGMPNMAISNNLFYGINNARIPAESFTVFQTGRAEVTHGRSPARSAKETPVANYFGVWMGFSPVRSRTVSTREQYIPTGTRTSVSDPVFRQGGGGTPFDDLVAANFLLFDSIDQSISRVNFQNIDDLFVQVGLDVSTQQAVRRLTTNDTSRFRLVPHVAIDGNRTGGESVLRYYAGAIFGDQANAYVGGDYTLQTESGWNAFARLDLYSAPDLDYFSEVEMRASRTLTFGPGRQFTMGVGAVAALDGMNRSRAPNTTLFNEDSRRRADLVMRLREGPVDLTLRQRFTKAAAGDMQRSTTLGLSFAKDSRFLLSAQVTPFSTETTWLQAAAELNWRLAQTAQRESSLQIQMARTKYAYGNSATGERLHISENTFRLGLQARF